MSNHFTLLQSDNKSMGRITYYILAFAENPAKRQRQVLSPEDYGIHHDMVEIKEVFDFSSIETFHHLLITPQTPRSWINISMVTLHSIIFHRFICSIKEHLDSLSYFLTNMKKFPEIFTDDGAKVKLKVETITFLECHLENVDSVKGIWQSLKNFDLKQLHIGLHKTKNAECLISQYYNESSSSSTELKLSFLLHDIPDLPFLHLGQSSQQNIKSLTIEPLREFLPNSDHQFHFNQVKMKSQGLTLMIGLEKIKWKVWLHSTICDDSATTFLHSLSLLENLKEIRVEENNLSNKKVKAFEYLLCEMNVPIVKFEWIVTKVCRVKSDVTNSFIEHFIEKRRSLELVNFGRHPKLAYWLGFSKYSFLVGRKLLSECLMNNSIPQGLIPHILANVSGIEEDRAPKIIDSEKFLPIDYLEDAGSNALLNIFVKDIVELFAM